MATAEYRMTSQYVHTQQELLRTEGFWQCSPIGERNTEGTTHPLHCVYGGTEVSVRFRFLSSFCLNQLGVFSENVCCCSNAVLSSPKPMINPCWQCYAVDYDITVNTLEELYLCVIIHEGIWSGLCWFWRKQHSVIYEEWDHLKTPERIVDDPKKHTSTVVFQNKWNVADTGL